MASVLLNEISAEMNHLNPVAEQYGSGQRATSGKSLDLALDVKSLNDVISKD